MDIKPYSYDKAVRRTELFEYPSERNLWLANKMLIHDIKKSSFSGYHYADVEVTIYSSGFDFDNDGQIYVTMQDLQDMYKEEGYYTELIELTNGQLKVEGYRLEVVW